MYKWFVKEIRGIVTYIILVSYLFQVLLINVNYEFCFISHISYCKMQRIYYLNR